MMSHEEPQVRGEEGGGTEEEEGDLEARTAVEALLALTSPMDYTQHPAYEDEYIMESGMEHYADKSLSFKESSPAMYGLQSQSADIQPEGEAADELQAVTARVCREERQVLARSEELERKDVAAAIPASNSNKSSEGNAQLRMLAELPESLKGSTLSLSETDSSGDEHDKLYKDLCKAAQQTSRQDEVLGFSSSLNKRPSEGTLKKVCDSSAGKWCGISGEKIIEAKYQRRSSSESSESSLKKNLGRTSGKGTMECGVSSDKDEASSVTELGSLGPASLRRASQEGLEKEKRKQESETGKEFVSKESHDLEMLKDPKCSSIKGAIHEDDSNNEGEDNDSDDDSDSDSDSDSSSSDSDDDDDDDEVSDSDSDSDSDEKSEEKLKTTESKKDESKEVVKANMEKNILETDHERMKVRECLPQGKEVQSCEVKEKPQAKATKINQQSASVSKSSAMKEEISITSDARVTEVKEKCPTAEKEKTEGNSSVPGEAESSTSDAGVQNEGRKVSSEVSAGEAGKTVRQSKDRREDKRRDVEANGDKENDSPRDNTKNVDKSTKSERKPPASLKKQHPKGQKSSPLSSTPVNVSEVDLVQQVAVAFAQQLNTIQGSQAKQGTAKSHSPQERPVKGETEVNQDCEDKSEHDMAPTEDEKMDMEIDDTFPMPIQAEVVMSEGSESGIEYEDFDKSGGSKDDFSWYAKREQLLDQSEKENLELVAYLQSFVNGGGAGEVVEYPPPNNELPGEGADLTQWQLDGVHLPPFTPNVAPPSWLRLTIPAEGYRCHSCGDTFFIESSLVQHRERRSVWINLECGPCDAKLTFYNRCALKDHLRNHMMQGEEVDEETVEVRSLPLQLTRLLQPILVPIPQSLRVNKQHRRSTKSRGTVNKLPVLKPIGRTPAKVYGEDYQNGSLENLLEDEEGNEDDRSRFSSEEKIPLGMKRLSPRKRTVRCYLCERMFHSVRELMSHMRTDQPYSDQRVECRKCQLVLPSVCAAKAHILTHPPANTSNISVCPECGSRCDGPRDFVHHLNTCGHQFRRSGIVCPVCQVCFFKVLDDFLTHWMAEHCAKSYECVVCRNTFESLVFHKCTTPGQQVLATFRCLLTCPLCSVAVQLHAQEEHDTNGKIKAHLADAHPSIITRVHYVYKSKFCTNAFRSKDELRAHHDREHRRDNHYRTKTCTLHHEVLGYQHQYFGGQEPRNAFVTLPVALSAEELHEARIRDVPTVSSVIDKTLFPDVPHLQEVTKSGKAEKQAKKNCNKAMPEESEAKESSGKDSPAKKDMDQLDKLRPSICYRCGFTYMDNKDFRRHKRMCEGEAAERQCQVCGLTAVGEDFARHCLTHIRDGVILCIYCNGMQFNNATDLEQHFELHVHEQFSYPASCAFCCTSLPDVPTALSHLNEEHDPFHVPFDTSEFECDRCGRRFHGERGLSVHLGRCTLGTATPTPSSAGCRQCQVCTKALMPEMFGRHLVCHLEEGLLVCSLCDGRTLPSSMALLHHLEEHATALAYPSNCPMCSFVMQDSTSALTHLKEEHGFGNLHCAECDMHYNFTYQLQRHTDIVHKICQYAKRRYICWICRAYDHVKKETLMNHFRTVHGLDREQVDEKAMIRTRGQGTMPTSQFIPTKPLGSKEMPGGSRQDADAVSVRLSRDKVKTSPGKMSVGSGVSSKHPSNKSTQSSPVKSMDSKPTSPTSIKSPLGKREDAKLKEKTKVLIKRLPDSILDEQSRSKRRKTSIDEEETKKSTKSSIKERKRKKKAYRCTTCGFGTNSREKYEVHSTKHKEHGEDGGAEGFVCQECGASFVVEPSLARHMFFAHKVKLQVTSDDRNPGKSEVKADVQEETVISMESEDTEKEQVFNAKVKVEEEEEEPEETKEEETEKPEVKETEMDIKVEEEETLAKRKVSRAAAKKSLRNAPPKKKPEVSSLRRKEETAVSKKKPESIPKKPPDAGTVKRRNERNVSKKKAGKVVTRTKKEKEASRPKQEREMAKRKVDKKVEFKKIEDYEEEERFDNQCVVCKEEFTSPVELYSHLRTHGMAFLKLGRKARPFGLEKTADR
ncbi:uncharacterized protein LOC122253595 isoform X2 [Penaeus japonicus]|uniref:uncharacterized protein LOC122253595 isoform X2 n=1 Tax=Penaeus japonicus TaxID=27405 RepID=UPI001C715C44|nr:uncharacterized protein LOC122253595 isoform X2 [Penaeus japonicus]